MPNISDKMVKELLSRYDQIMSDWGAKPEWSVHKRNTPDELVKCTIPFVGTHYAEQEKRILVYASAENLAGYYLGNTKDWPGDWLDDDDQAQNRHRRCFDDLGLQGASFFPHVHIGPMNDGGLATAVMYLVSKTRDNEAMPRELYEMIAFGNYGKYSIETPFQKAVRLNPQLSTEEKKKLKKDLNGRNEDYATKQNYLEESHAYIRADIEVLKPDFIIMPCMNDDNFIDSIKGSATIICINQINGTVVNNMAPNSRNNYHSKYNAYKPEQLSPALQMACDSIKGINRENFMYMFGYLDSVLQGNGIP